MSRKQEGMEFYTWTPRTIRDDIFLSEETTGMSWSKTNLLACKADMAYTLAAATAIFLWKPPLHK